MKLLFIGETWNGSSARSLRDAIARSSCVTIDDVGEDHFRPKGRSALIRIANRILRPLYQKELAREILHRIPMLKPNVVVVYKGNLISEETVKAVRACGVPVVNVFPDYSPHVYGKQLRRAMGAYDLVVSTKPFHPALWNTTFGYKNRCEFVPHGYDPDVHYWPGPPEKQDIDLVMAATWRPQYERILVDVADGLADQKISVAIAGGGWHQRRNRFPRHWQFPGSFTGRSYGEFVRRGRVVIAPVNSEVLIGGKRFPGDEDTTRTYELAAACTFFLHQRTPFASQLYKEGEEVVFWTDARDLVQAIRCYLPRDQERRRIALAAHRRAVPRYSIPSRAEEILDHVRTIVRLR